MKASLEGLHRDDRGFSLVELLVTLAILSVVGILSVTLLVTALRTDDYSRQETTALDELRFATEFITKEVRQARLVYPDSTDQYLHIWIDYDIDNQQDADERIVYEIDTTGITPTLIRYSEAGTPTRRILMEGIVVAPLFTYEPAFPAVPRTVGMTLQADVDPTSEPNARTVMSEVRIRNAATP